MYGAKVQCSQLDAAKQLVVEYDFPTLVMAAMLRARPMEAQVLEAAFPDIWDGLRRAITIRQAQAECPVRTEVHTWSALQ